MRKKLIALIVALFASVGMLTFSAESASAATTGGWIYNVPESNGSLYITAQRPVSSYYSLPRDRVSLEFINNTQGFKANTGWRITNTDTGYVYSSGVWHYMCCNNTHLRLKITWIG